MLKMSHTKLACASLTFLAVACGKNLPTPSNNSVSANHAPWEDVSSIEDDASGFLSRSEVIRRLSNPTVDPSEGGAAPEMELLPLDAMDTTTAIRFKEEYNPALMGLIAKPAKGGFTTRPTDTPVKSQGNRGWCTAFGATGVVENIINQKYGKVVDLSEMSLWEQYAQPYTTKAVKAATQGLGWGLEKDMPYSLPFPNNVKLTSAQRVVKASGLKVLKSVKEVFKALEAGYPLEMDAVVNESFASTRTGIIRSGGNAKGGHAFELAGYEIDKNVPGGGYFVIKNSWGDKTWGDKGYGYMPFDYCNYFYGCNFYQIEDAVLAGATPVNPNKPDTPTDPSKPTDPTKPTPKPTPTVDPSKPQSDIKIKLVFEGQDSDGGQIFHLAMKGTPELMAKIKRVTYGLHPAFREGYKTVVDANANAKANGFSTRSYVTYAKEWETSGAKLEFTDGSVEFKPGVVISFE